MLHSMMLTLLLAIAQAPAPLGPVARFSATIGTDPVRIDVMTWSTDAARSQLVDAWNMLPPAPGAAAGATGGRGARGARGAAAPETPAAAPARGARGTRGGAPAGPPAAGARGGDRPDTPEKSLAAALQSAEGVGYLWTSESTGYSLRYAYRSVQPDGHERIILATDRRLGEWDGFSVIELRLDAKHEGEGKASAAGKVGLDSAGNTIALQDYAALPVMLKGVKPR